jgi:hypothetical protein
MNRAFIARWTRMPPFHRAIERFGVITSQPVLGGLLSPI